MGDRFLEVQRSTTLLQGRTRYLENLKMMLELVVLDNIRPYNFKSADESLSAVTKARP
jgi:hypothetical protein